MKTSKVVVLEVVKKPDGYIEYICEDCNNPNEYLWLSRPLNWESTHEPIKGSIGYIKYEEVLSGDTRYFNTQTMRFDTYMYDVTYFRSFILETTEKKDQYIL